MANQLLFQQSPIKLNYSWLRSGTKYVMDGQTVSNRNSRISDIKEWVNWIFVILLINDRTWLYDESNPFIFPST